MTANQRIEALKNKPASDITVLVVAENPQQRLAFSDTVKSCGFLLIDCVSRDQLAQKPKPPNIDIWLIDSDYDEFIIDAIAASNYSAVLVGFSRAPYLNELPQYAKWQRKLKRKFAQLLNLPELLGAKNTANQSKPWQLVVFLGASMGGPEAVKEFLDHLPPSLPICLLLAHHFNQNMIETLPRILNRHNTWYCQIITSTRRLQSGYCLIAPIDQQIICDSEGRVILLPQPWAGEYKPAIGQLLKNMSDVYGSDLVSIIFSGMGQDGSQYLASIQDNQSQLWAQDPSLSTCSSQPQAIIDSGFCQFVGSPKALAKKLIDVVNERERHERQVISDLSVK